ncbi:aspartate kinase [Oryzihumus sp.]|uniref:aspartate kinase n=1 Tax=Oryzihumus sp. TaxID=1968903 RepID=UPI002EDA8F07
MSLIVQKYGGSSLADAESIKRVARRIVETRRAGNEVCVVVSAMGDTTDELLDLAEEVSPLPPGREMDMLLTAGERISMALVAMAIANLGHQARSFTGSQAGVITDSTHGKARIIDVTPGRIRAALAEGHVAIVAGFQGVSQDSKDITTLGRGGSDTTAVALAAALEADVCEIYTDVDGVFTADPRIVPAARKIDRLSNEEMLEMAASGAKILHLRCVEYARRFGMPIHVRSSFSYREGTWIIDPEEGVSVEAPIIAGVAHDRSEAKITVVGVPDHPGKAAEIFQACAKAGVNIDMIVQNVSAVETGLTDISFTLPKTDGQHGVQALKAVQESVGFASLQYDDHIGKLSLVGAGMRSHPGVSATFFQALADAGVNIEMISTSEIRISVVTRDDQLDDAVRAVHTAFGLDSAEGEAVVYGGTGR